MTDSSRRWSADMSVIGRLPEHVFCLGTLKPIERRPRLPRRTRRSRLASREGRRLYLSNRLLQSGWSPHARHTGGKPNVTGLIGGDALPGRSQLTRGAGTHLGRSRRRERRGAHRPRSVRRRPRRSSRFHPVGPVWTRPLVC